MKTSSPFFDRFAEKFDTFYDGKRSRFMQWVDTRFRRDMFERFELTFVRLGDLTDKSVVDIGCGSGPYLTEALRRGASHVTGIDPAPGMLQLARRRVEAQGMSDRVELLAGEFPDVDPGRTYDYAIVMGVMDYVPDPVAFLAGVRRIADGAAISFPSRHLVRTPIRKVRYWLRRCPVHFFDEGRIRAAATAAGYDSVEVEKIAGAGMDYVVWLVR